jgi:hypothetical protein
MLLASPGFDAYNAAVSCTSLLQEMGRHSAADTATLAGTQHLIHAARVLLRNPSVGPRLACESVRASKAIACERPGHSPCNALVNTIASHPHTWPGKILSIFESIGGWRLETAKKNRKNNEV